MRRSQRLIAATVLIALSGALGGCSSGFGNWDPTDLLDFLDTKKKLPGERKPVFPDGVPGLEQGVPKELYKGSRQEQIDQNAQAAAAATAPTGPAKGMSETVSAAVPTVCSTQVISSLSMDPPGPCSIRATRATP